MLLVSSHFLARADGTMRPISWALFISFARELLPATGFFTVGESIVGGSDIIKGAEDVVQQWDKFQYLDYSDRLLSVDWSQTIDPIYSVQSALGDLVLNNSDNYLSADNFALPYRPVRLSVGFGNTMTGDPELLPQFVGVTTEAPTIDRITNTASYTLTDFLGTLFNRKLDQAVMLTNVRTDQALDALLQIVGLSPTQYDLDPGFNIIPFVYFDPTTLFGDAAQQLMLAEMGRLFMSETGRVTFHNRQHDGDNESVWMFDGHNVIDFTSATEDNIVNLVQVTSSPLEVQQNQPYYQLSTGFEVPPGATVQEWPNFSDPVLSVDPPVYIDDATTSSFTTNTLEDGSGSPVTSGIMLGVQLFATSFQMNFTNTNGFPVWITDIQLYAAPAKSVDTITVVEQDDDSIAQYDEHPLSPAVNNNFFVDEDSMISFAKKVLSQQAAFGQVQTLTVKSNPALQNGDVVTVKLRQRTYIAVTGDTLTTIAADYTLNVSTLETLNPPFGATIALDDGQKINLGVFEELYKIIGRQNSLISPQLSQVLTIIPYVPLNFFTVGVSTVGGSDAIAP